MQTNAKKLLAGLFGLLLSKLKKKTPGGKNRVSSIEVDRKSPFLEGKEGEKHSKSGTLSYTNEDGERFLWLTLCGAKQKLLCYCISVFQVFT